MVYLILGKTRKLMKASAPLTSQACLFSLRGQGGLDLVTTLSWQQSYSWEVLSTIWQRGKEETCWDSLYSPFPVVRTWSVRSNHRGKGPTSRYVTMAHVNFWQDWLQHSAQWAPKILVEALFEEMLLCSLRSWCSPPAGQLWLSCVLQAAAHAPTLFCCSNIPSTPKPSCQAPLYHTRDLTFMNIVIIISTSSEIKNKKALHKAFSLTASPEMTDPPCVMYLTPQLYLYTSLSPPLRLTRPRTLYFHGYHFANPHLQCYL